MRQVIPEQRYMPNRVRITSNTWTSAGQGCTPVGYGYRSVEFILASAMRVAAEADLPKRQAMLRELDAQGILATPGNSSYNERLLEAARKSILSGVQVEVEPA